MIQVQIPALPLRTVGCEVPIYKTGQWPLPQDKRRPHVHHAPSQRSLNSNALQLTQGGSGSTQDALA